MFSTSKFRICQFLLLFWIGSVSSYVSINATTVIKNYNGKLFLDTKKNFHMEWNINWEQATLEFTITADTVGYVGLGFSKDGSMKDADIVVAGVMQDGSPYISDAHSDCHRELKTDVSQDWSLISARESKGITTVKMSRRIDTCDPEDYPITDDLVQIIWAYGETDVVDYHHQDRGIYLIYLLDPVLHPSPAANSLPKWRATKRVAVPPKVTTYWCSIFKAPKHNRKQHMIQMEAWFENLVAVNHTHHFVLYKCSTPPGVDPRSVFEPLLNYEGEECFFNERNIIPVAWCGLNVYVWALGGRPLILPDYVGIPFSGPEDQYYMLQSHFNNPQALPGIVFESGVEVVYTDRLRPKDGGAIMVNYDLFGLFMIPPGTLKLPVYSYCPSECTGLMFPNDGIDIFAIHTHTHWSGKKIKLHHYRNGIELPWIIKDDNYDFNFQNPRPLQSERKVLPGDQLMLECIYDDTWTNATTPAGFSGKDEMCLQILYHTNPVPYQSCTSTIPQEKFLNLVGVRNVTWDLWTQERIVTSPPNLRGVTLAEVTDFRIKWTRDLREAVNRENFINPQIATCLTTNPIPGPIKNAQTIGLQLSGIIPFSVPIPTTIAQRPTVNAEYRRVRACP